MSPNRKFKAGDKVLVGDSRSRWRYLATVVESTPGMMSDHDAASIRTDLGIIIDGRVMFPWLISELQHMSVTIEHANYEGQGATP